jgi:hypothetical protein
MSKVQRHKAQQTCRVCGATTNAGKAWCSLHHPKKGTTAHKDKYARSGNAAA